MNHTILLDNVSDDEDPDSPETISPAPKKFRKSILCCSKQAQNKRLDELYTQLLLYADTEEISPVQLMALLLQGHSIVKGTFANNKFTQKLSVESASQLMSTLEIGKTAYIKMRGIFKSELGSAVIPRYELVSGFNTSITPTVQALMDQYTCIRYPLLPAITSVIDVKTGLSVQFLFD